MDYLPFSFPSPRGGKINQAFVACFIGVGGSSPLTVKTERRYDNHPAANFRLDIKAAPQRITTRLAQISSTALVMREVGKSKHGIITSSRLKRIIDQFCL